MIREIFTKLNTDDKEAIMIAFNDLTPHYIRLENNRFIGVHLAEAPELIIEHVEGFWSVGRIR